MYRIVRAISNNFVCSKDESGKEVVLRGRGIGFRKQPGDLVPPNQIEKVYALSDVESSSKLIELIGQIPEEHLAVSTAIIEHAEKRLDRALSEKVYITLTDHISFAIERYHKGIQYPNNLLWEIRSFYPTEYALGEEALAIIRTQLGVALSEDEAGFIALHIVNAQLGSGMSDMVRITEFIRESLSIAEQYYAIALNEHSIDCGRFITHLKFLGQRIFKKKTLPKNEDSFLSDMIRKRYTHDFQCAQKIGERVVELFQIPLSDEELIFLTIHLHRLSVDNSES